MKDRRAKPQDASRGEEHRQGVRLGSLRGAALEGRQPQALRRRADPSHGALGQRQDHAFVDPRLHPVADRGRARGRRQLDRRPRRRRPRQDPAPARRLRVPGLQPVPDDDGKRERDAGARCARSSPSSTRPSTRSQHLPRSALRHRAEAFPSKLSGGEKQRVAIARALAGRPSVILADEPTAALDAENGRAVMALLQEVAKDPNRAVLAVTHDHRTMPYADRIIRIEDGVISSDVAPEKGRHAARPATHDEPPSRAAKCTYSTPTRNHPTRRKRKAAAGPL